MKLKNEIDFVTRAFSANIEKIKDYVPALKASGNYNNFETRLAFDCLRAFCGTSYICELYDKYGCNDTHVATLGKTVLKNLEVL